jgi:hypothetical protein
VARTRRGAPPDRGVQGVGVAASSRPRDGGARDRHAAQRGREDRWDEAAGLSLDVVAYAAPQEHTALNAAERRGQPWTILASPGSPPRTAGTAGARIGASNDVEFASASQFEASFALPWAPWWSGRSVVASLQRMTHPTGFSIPFAGPAILLPEFPCTSLRKSAIRREYIRQRPARKFALAIGDPIELG